MTMKILTGAVSAAMNELYKKSMNDKYYDDPVLWAEEVLGVHLWSKQREIAYSLRDNKRTAVRSSNGVGKDLPLDTPLPTPTGWTTMGDVQVGDYLLDETGKPTKVTFKSQVMHNDLYRITFSDGAIVVASGTHEWNTIDFHAIGRYRNKHTITDYRDLWDLSETRNTKDIADTLMHGSNRNHYVPVNGALRLPEQDLPIDPYVLGVWLGDGDSVSMGLSLGDTKTHIPEEFEKRGVPLVHKDVNANYERYTFHALGGTSKLRELNLYKNKHIPKQYLRASYRQRLDLLRGLMDTDGFNNTSANRSVTGVGIDLMNETLALAVVELVRTLGARCSVTKDRTYLNGKDAGPRWRMVFNPTFDPFTPGSQKSIARNDVGAQQARKTVRTIVSVEPVPTVPTQCVQVDSPRHLYLATEYMIPTHNTMVCGVLASWWIATRYPNDPQQTVVVVTAPAFPQIKTNLFHELNVEMTRSKEKTYSNGEPKGTAFQPLPGHISTSGNIAQWLSPEGAQLAIGRKPADGDVIRTFAGIHRKNILFIIDEAGGVSPDMFVSAERLTTNAGAKILIVGNPDRRGSEFFKTFDEDSDWNKIRISAFDTPTHTGEPCPEELLEYMPSPEWVQRNIKAWGGPEDPRVQIAIYGNFPDSDDSVFFPERIINQAQDTEIDPLLDATAILGVDLAMQGKDESRIYLNKGGRIRLVKSWPGESARKNAETIIEAIIETEADIVNIDSGGIGTPIIERMLELVQERDDVPPFRLTRMNSSEVSPDPRRWYNMRAYWYDMLRTGIIEGKVDLDIDRKIKGQLTDIGFSIWDTGTRAGSIIMESKKDMRSRVGYSPDDVDAIVYSFFNPDTMLEEKAPKKSYTDPIDILGGEDFLPNYFTAMESVYGLSI